MVGLYFSGSHSLVDWIAPRTVLRPDYGDRELGLLENAQHLILLITLIVIARGLPKIEHPLPRAGFIGAFFVIAIMLAEEIDYGAHYWDFMTQTERFEGNFNLHNTGEATQTLKQISDLSMLCWFLLLPLSTVFIKSRWLNYLSPPRLIMLTVLSALLVSQLAHALDDRGLAIRGPLSGNISEFRELFTYYIWLLYCIAMISRPWPGHRLDSGQRDGVFG